MATLPEAERVAVWAEAMFPDGDTFGFRQDLTDAEREAEG